MLRYILAIILCGALFRLSEINPKYGAGIIVILAVLFLVKTNSGEPHEHVENDQYIS
jgi:hypothetical protein